jgi:uncharacterized protein YjaG (DUF416 family)
MGKYVKISYQTMDETLYDDMLDNVWGEMTILGATLSASRILKELDPILYDVGFRDWQNNQD